MAVLPDRPRGHSPIGLVMLEIQSAVNASSVSKMSVMWCMIRSSSAPPTSGMWTLHSLASRSWLPVPVSVRKYSPRKWPGPCGIEAEYVPVA